MSEKSVGSEIAGAAIDIASELAKRLLSLIDQGEDWEPIVDLLPDPAKTRAKHELARSIAKKKLEDVRKSALGE